MITNFIARLRTLIAGEPIRAIYLVGIAAQVLYGQLSGGASLENAAIAVAIAIFGEVQRSQVSPAA